MFGIGMKTSVPVMAARFVTRSFSSLARPATPFPFRTPVIGATSNTAAMSTPNVTGHSSPISILGLVQRRFKSRGNTYQPSTLKRKRTFGFLARLRSKNGRKILQKRRQKGRWYLSH